MQWAQQTSRRLCHALSVPPLGIRSGASSLYRAHIFKAGSGAPRIMWGKVPADMLAAANGHASAQHTVPLLLDDGWEGAGVQRAGNPELGQCW